MDVTLRKVKALSVAKGGRSQTAAYTASTVDSRLSARGLTAAMYF
jgi:uncharacterized protein YabE (DUF348 family)